MRTESPEAHNRFSVRGQTLIDGRLQLAVVIVEDGSITEVRTGDVTGGFPVPVYDADLVSPGLIDLQLNGAFGLEVDSGPEALRALAARLPASGVTTFLPALVSGTAAVYQAAATAWQAARGAAGARMPGLHLEGPLLSPARAGAHDPAAIAAAPATLDQVLEGLLQANAVRLMTLAPEVPGALPLIRRLHAAGVAVSLGHTDAAAAEIAAGIDAGATLVTHLYSAMRGFHHREPGAVGIALTDERVAVTLIADGVHAHAAALALALRAKGPDGVVLVTDAVAAAGAAPGSYALAGRPIVSDGAAARLADGTLAGSILTMDRAVRQMMSLAGASLAQALTMASATPARRLGLTRSGRIAPGYDADLVLWSDDLQVQATFVGGRRAYPV